MCADRIVGRGAAHQSLVPDAANARAHEDVLWMFLRQAEPPAEAEADAAVEMELEEGLEDALARAVGGVVEVLGLEKPGAERMGEALAAARAYVPTVRAGEKADKKAKKALAKAQKNAGNEDVPGTIYIG